MPPSASLSNIRIAVSFRARARVSRSSGPGRPHLVHVFPQIAALERVWPRLPRLRTRLQLGLAKLNNQHAFFGIEDDHVAIAQKRDRAADSGLRSDMANAKSTRGT